MSARPRDVIREAIDFYFKTKLQNKSLVSDSEEWQTARALELLAAHQYKFYALVHSFDDGIRIYLFRSSRGQASYFEKDEIEEIIDYFGVKFQPDKSERIEISDDIDLLDFLPPLIEF